MEDNENQDLQTPAAEQTAENAQIQGNAEPVNEEIIKQKPATDVKNDIDYNNTGLDNLKNIAEQKGIDFDEVMQSYVANNCQLTDEMKQKCLEKGITEDFIQRASEGIKALHDKEMNSVAEVIGGRENLTKTLEWGRQNLTKEELADIQTDLSGNPSLTTAQALVFYIHNKMVSSEGKPPEYIQDTTGGTALTDIFKSKAEALKAMSDPRYDCTHKDYDEAYAKELEAKLDRTKTANGGFSLFG